MQNQLFNIQKQIRENTMGYLSAIEDIQKWKEEVHSTEESLLQSKLQKTVERNLQEQEKEPVSVSVGRSGRKYGDSTTKTTIKGRLITKEQELDYLEYKKQGNASFQRGEYKDAIAAYSSCLTIVPRDVVSLSNRAQCYLLCYMPVLALQDTNECLTTLQSYIPIQITNDSTNNTSNTNSSMNPKDNIALKNKTLFRRACAYKLMLQYTNAMKDLNSITGKMTNSSEVINIKTELQQLVEKEDKIKEISRKATTKKKELFKIAVTYGSLAISENINNNTNNSSNQPYDSEEWEEVDIIYHANEEDTSLSSQNIDIPKNNITWVEEDTNIPVNTNIADIPVQPTSEKNEDEQTNDVFISNTIDLENMNHNTEIINEPTEDIDDSLTILPNPVYTSGALETYLREINSPATKAAYLLSYLDMKVVTELLTPVLTTTLLAQLFEGTLQLLHLQTEAVANAKAAPEQAKITRKSLLKLLRMIIKTKAFPLLFMMQNEEEKSIIQQCIQQFKSSEEYHVEDKYTKSVNTLAASCT